MFQNIFVESNRRLSPATKYLSLISILVNGLILLVLILWPLIHPEALPKQAVAMLFVAPAPAAAPMPVVRAAPSPRAPSRAAPLTVSIAAPSQISKSVFLTTEAAPSMDLQAMVGQQLTGIHANLPVGIVNSIGRGQAPTVSPPPLRKVTISSGVMIGNKLSGLDPVYPLMARNLRMQGTVVLQATIAKDGTIENLRVLSGPPMLATSAVDAVKTWRYKPYLLNEQPVEVETTIQVVFRLDN